MYLSCAAAASVAGVRRASYNFKKTDIRFWKRQVGRRASTWLDTKEAIAFVFDIPEGLRIIDHQNAKRFDQGRCFGRIQQRTSWLRERSVILAFDPPFSVQKQTGGEI